MSTPFEPDQPDSPTQGADGQPVPPPPASPQGVAGGPVSGPPFPPQHNPYASQQHPQGFPSQQGPGQPGQQWGQGYPQQPGVYGGYAAPTPRKSLTSQVQQATLFLYIAAGLIVGAQVVSFLTGLTMSYYGFFRVWTALASLLQIAGMVMLFLSIWKSSLIVGVLAKKVDATENAE